MGDRTVTELVVWAADGDRVAWNELVDRYAGLVWSVARAYGLAHCDAADVVQTSWLRLVENLDRLRWPERVGAWLAATARHECLRTLRRSRRERPAASAGDGDDACAAAPSAETLALERAGHTAVLGALAELPERCRRLLRLLAAAPPPSYAEVSAALDIPVGSIGPTRARCLRRLRRALDTWSTPGNRQDAEQPHTRPASVLRTATEPDADRGR